PSSVGVGTGHPCEDGGRADGGGTGRGGDGSGRADGGGTGRGGDDGGRADGGNAGRGHEDGGDTGGGSDDGGRADGGEGAAGRHDVPGREDGGGDGEGPHRRLPQRPLLLRHTTRDPGEEPTVRGAGRLALQHRPTHTRRGCQSGKRSELACIDLLAAGFMNVKNVGGGYAAWLHNGLPVTVAVPTPPPTPES
uniref:Rhodanese domain-containing protein n=1 Tax=Aegilops tauschii subsp. strangulata TaxID=200361 RepID=A0A453QZ39_AEGTS